MRKKFLVSWLPNKKWKRPNKSKRASKPHCRPRRLKFSRTNVRLGERSLLVDAASGFLIAKFLRDDAQLKLDYCSNVTGIDWPDKELTEKIKVKQVVDGVEKEVEEVKKTIRPGYLEVVYHLYSMELEARSRGFADAHGKPRG